MLRRQQMKNKLAILVRLSVVIVAILAMHRIDSLEKQLVEAKRPIILYQVDSAGASMVGKITSKEIIDGKYTLDCGVYGRFLVTKELYDSVQVGDEIPEELRGGRK